MLTYADDILTYADVCSRCSSASESDDLRLRLLLLLLCICILFLLCAERRRSLGSQVDVFRYPNW
jgi:hypothetical protein